MTDHDDDLRTSLHDPALDAGISANALLAGVHRRKHRLQQRQRTVRVSAAALAAVVVIWGTALLVPDRTPTLQPAQQPTVEETTTPARPPAPQPTPQRPPTPPIPTTPSAAGLMTVKPSGSPAPVGPAITPTNPPPTG